MALPLDRMPITRYIDETSNIEILSIDSVGLRRTGIDYSYFVGEEQITAMYQGANLFANSRPMLYTDYGTLSEVSQRYRKIVTTIANDVPHVLDPELASSFRSRTNYLRSTALTLPSVEWYGTKDGKYIVSDKRVYPKLAEALSFFDEFESELRIDPETDVPKPKTQYTSRPNGIFTFSRVAPTLYAFPCYVSDMDQEDCISPSSVVKREGRYYLADAPDVELLIKGFEKRETGQEKFRTQAKKVYAVKQLQSRITDYIHIYVSLGANAGVEADDMRYNSFAAVAMARLLTQAGFKVAITAIDVSISSSQNYSMQPLLNELPTTIQYAVNLYRIKSYNEQIDINSALIYGGDPAFFRYDVFQHCVAGFALWNKELEPNLGRAVTDEDDIDTILQRYGIFTSKAETRVVIAGRFGSNTAKDGVRSKIAELKVLYGK